MSISFVGWASNPADNGTNSTVPCAITTSGFTSAPAANDLLLFLSCFNNTSNSQHNSISQAGGQTWTSFIDFAGNGSSTAIFRAWWATYTGTFSANPSFTNGLGSGAAASGLMLAFRSSGLVSWSIDSGGASSVASYAAPSTPFNVTATGQTPTSPNTVSVGIFNTIGGGSPSWALQTGGWTNPGAQAQWRNTAHASYSIGYLIQSIAAATGNVTNQQNATGYGGYAGMVTFTDGSVVSVPAPLMAWPKQTFVREEIIQF